MLASAFGVSHSSPTTPTAVAAAGGIASSSTPPGAPTRVRALHSSDVSYHIGALLSGVTPRTTATDTPIASTATGGVATSRQTAVAGGTAGPSSSSHQGETGSSSNATAHQSIPSLWCLSSNVLLATHTAEEFESQLGPHLADVVCSSQGKGRWPLKDFVDHIEMDAYKSVSLA